jgi:bacterioferritin-associated ferredoxin
MTNENETLGEALPKEIARVTEVLANYHEVQAMCGPQVDCGFAIAMIKQSLADANEAMISGDIVAMFAAYKDLKDIE